MIRVGIVEDDTASAALLVDYLRRYEHENGETFVVTGFMNGNEAVAGYRPDLDILLLDVEMPGIDGFGVAERVRRVDSEVVLIFITNMAQYAIRGYRVDAQSYLLKPVPYFAFAQEIERSIDKIRRRTTDYLMLSVDGDVVRVATKDIVFLESAKHRTIVHTLDGEHSVVGPLKEFEAKVDAAQFYRCNSGYLVNLRHVRAVQGNSAVTVDGHDILISRSRKKGLLTALTDYLGAHRT